MLRPDPAINMALLTEGGCGGRSCYKHCPPNGGAGMEWPKLETSMNRGVNENAALKPDKIQAGNHNPRIRLKHPIDGSQL